MLWALELDQETVVACVLILRPAWKIDPLRRGIGVQN